MAEQGVEIVERKGKGHPDYICDPIMDAISIALSREYMKEFGAILHHNIDKGLLAAGCTVKQFGDGSQPTVADRAGCSRASISNKMNEVIKVLTIIGTIFIPLTFTLIERKQNEEKSEHVGGNLNSRPCL